MSFNIHYMKTLYSNLCGMMLFFVKNIYAYLTNLKDIYQDTNIG